MDAVSDIHHRSGDHAQAAEWTTKAAEAGLPKAMFNLGAGAYTRPLFGST